RHHLKYVGLLSYPLQQRDIPSLPSRNLPLIRRSWWHPDYTNRLPLRPDRWEEPRVSPAIFYVLSDSSILLPPIRTMDSSALEYPCGGLLTQFLPADPHPSYQGGEYSAPFHAHLLPAIPDEGSLPVFPICRHRLKSPYWQEPQRFLHSRDSALQWPCMPDQWFAPFHCGRF